MAHCVLAQWVIVTKLISQYLKNILLIQDKDKKRSGPSIMEQPGKDREWFPSIFCQKRQNQWYFQHQTDHGPWYVLLSFR